MLSWPKAWIAVVVVVIAVLASNMLGRADGIPPYKPLTYSGTLDVACSLSSTDSTRSSHRCERSECTSGQLAPSDPERNRLKGFAHHRRADLDAGAAEVSPVSCDAGRHRRWGTDSATRSPHARQGLVSESGTSNSAPLTPEQARAILGFVPRLS